MTDDVQGVRRREEALCIGQLVHHARDRALERGGRGHVNHSAARRAEEMVVMVEKVFGQFEPGEIVTRGDSTNHARPLEIGEMAVRRTAGHVWKLRFDVGDAEGMIGRGQEPH